MADVHNKETRSYNMSQIKGKDTRPELVVRKFLFSHGFRFRLHKKTLPGRPDIVLTKYRVIIFVHGCFWHGHEGCRYFVIPKTRTEWWLDKILATKKKDEENLALLKNGDWRVIIIWECDLNAQNKEATLNYLLKTLKSYKNE